MFSVLLTLHNLVRWVVVILAVYALARAYSGWLGKRPWGPADRQAGMFFTVGLDIQVLLGVILLVFDWFTTGSPGLFFLLWHIPLMIIGAALAHMGRVVSRKAPDDPGKHRLTAIWFTIGLLVVLIGIPWTRPLFRLG